MKLYFFLRPLTRIALKAYFRKITINGIENLPKDKALLLCSNHPTAFTDPCLMACFLPRTLHFLVRGDLFEKPILGKILVSTNQIPIFRFRDGYEKLRNNRELMNLSYEKLANGEAILIFPEASTLETKYLRPIKKGAARMALETLKLYPQTNLAVLPIGIDYSSSNRWRSYVNINIGKEIIPKLPKEDKDIPREITRLSNELKSNLDGLLLEKHEGLSDDKLDKTLDLSQWYKRVGSAIAVEYDNLERFLYSRKIASSLEEKEDLDFLSKMGNNFYLFNRGGYKFGHQVLAILILLPVLFLLAINALPVLIGVAIRNKYVGVNEFIGSIAIAASLGAYIILFAIAFLIGAIFCAWWVFLLFVLPIGGLIGLQGLDYIRRVYYNSKIRSKISKEELDQIISKADLLVSKLTKQSNT